MTEKELLAPIGSTIRRHRKKAELTIAMLAEQAGMDAGFLAYIENGKKMPSITTAAKLASALGLQLADLFSDVPDKTSDVNYPVERQIIALLHGCSPAHKKSVLSLLKGLRDPKRLEALRHLIHK